MSAFQNFTIEQVEAHNRRVAEQRMAYRQRDLERHEPKQIVPEPIVKQPEPSRKRLRQSSKPLLNKLEQEWLDRFKFQFKDQNVYSQAVKFRLANGCNYTPDFFTFFRSSQRWHAYEVKGKHSWDDAIVKLKVAAGLYPEIKWILVWKEKGQWTSQEILP